MTFFADQSHFFRTHRHKLKRKILVDVTDPLESPAEKSCKSCLIGAVA